MNFKPLALPFLVVLSACSSTDNPLDDYEQLTPATQLDAPVASATANFSPEEVERGRYLVGLLGCSSCHTNGALVGTPNMAQLLAGSDTGIAWTNPLAERNPGVVYPANLTPDKHSGQTLPVMPWPSYANIHAEDATAIAAYLLSLPPVSHRVPANARPGQRAPSPFVHFGVYQSRQ